MSERTVRELERLAGFARSIGDDLDCSAWSAEGGAPPAATLGDVEGARGDAETLVDALATLAEEVRGEMEEDVREVEPMPDRDVALAAAESALWDAYVFVGQLRRSVLPVGRPDLRQVAVCTDRALGLLGRVVDDGTDGEGER